MWISLVHGFTEDKMKKGIVGKKANMCSKKDLNECDELGRRKR